MTGQSTSLSREADPPTPLKGVGPIRTLARRDFEITYSYRAALASELMFGFLNLVVYYFISRTFELGHGSHLSGAPSYFAFASGGVALAVVLQTAAVGLTRRVREEQLAGTLEMLVVQPISPGELALGLAGFSFLFAVVRALGYLLLAGLLLDLSFAHTDGLGLIIALLASGAAFTAIGVALAAVVLVFKRADAIGALGIFAISLLGGAFFPRHVLPGWLQFLSNILPTRYAFAAVRAAQFGQSSWVRPSLYLLLFAVLAMAAALVLFSGALRHTIRHGTLNQY